MILPRRLFQTADGSFCEVDDVRQVKNFRPAGYPIPDAEAERIGLKAYLDETGWGDVAGVKAKPDAKVEEKAVAQAEVEDKAVEPPRASHPVEDVATSIGTEETEQKNDPESGLHIDPALRRGGRRS